MKIKVLEYKPRSDTQEYPKATIEIDDGQTLDVELVWWDARVPSDKNADKWVLEMIRDAVIRRLADEAIMKACQKLNSGTEFEMDLDD